MASPSNGPAPTSRRSCLSRDWACGLNPLGGSRINGFVSRSWHRWPPRMYTSFLRQSHDARGSLLRGSLAESYPRASQAKLRPRGTDRTSRGTCVRVPDAEGFRATRRNVMPEAYVWRRKNERKRNTEMMNGITPEHWQIVK